MPKIDAKTLRVAVTIAGYEFTCPQPYVAGHVLSEGEAEALNTLFADRVRTNMARAIADAIKCDGMGSSQQISIDVYASRYDFSSRADPIRRKAIDLAIDSIAARSKEDGVAMTAQELRSLAETIVSNGRYPQFLEQARKFVELQREIAEEELAR